MEANDKSCQPELISRFYDNELEPEKRVHVENHIKTCALCRERYENLRTLSEKIKTHVAAHQDTESSTLEDKVIESIQRKEFPWWRRAADLLLSKRILVPAGAIASLILIFFAVFDSPTVSGPSAIITSLSGNGSSVIIMETPQTRQTILWFNEEG